MVSLFTYGTLRDYPSSTCASKAFGSKIVCLPVGFMVCWHNYNPSNPCFSSQHRILSLYIRTHQLGRLLPLRTSLLEANIERPKVYLIAVLGLTSTIIRLVTNKNNG